MLVGLAITAALVALPALYLRDAGRERRRRSELFADVMALFDTCRVVQDGNHFPVLDGRYKGLSVRLEPVLDDIGVRKIPSLWIKTTLMVVNPSRGVLDLLVRPQGVEIYSPSHDLPIQIPLPQDWPRHAVLVTDNKTTMPSLEALTPHVRLFDDPRMKEMLITSLGVRLVYQAAQATRAEYLVLRQSNFSSNRLDPALAQCLLDAVIAIAADLDAVAREMKAA